MCIAVNEKGQAHKAFAIKIEGKSCYNFLFTMSFADHTSKKIFHLVSSHKYSNLLGKRAINILLCGSNYSVYHPVENLPF